MNWLRRLWTRLGQLGFWVAWPLLWIYLRRGERTRVLIVSEGQALVVKGWLGSGKWVLPGGGLHRGEDAKAGALRELYEETGLRLQPEDLQDGGFGKVTDSGLTFRYQAFVVMLPVQPFSRRWSLEIIETTWVPLQDLTTAVAETSTATLAKHYSDKATVS
jgi:8-oxo-dGTP pyrophosphatase MutT (NUDIX family)